jgi:hypothetical protein
MAIDFLGREIKEPKIKQKEELLMHKPEKENKTQPVKPPEVKKVAPPPKAPSLPEEKLQEVNLMIAFRRYLLKRRLTIIVFSAIFIIVLAGIAYYFVTRPKPPVVVVNTNFNKPPVININTTPPPPEPVCGNGLIEANEQCDLTGCASDQTCVNCQCKTVVTPPPPPPVCGNGNIESGEECDIYGCGVSQECINCLCQTTIFPDTELAPLRGALVKFAGGSAIYLVENNGELRYIDQPSVIFKNGENISQIGSGRIYVINNKFKDIRSGKDVYGFIDWDPRVLSQTEFLPFQ